MSRCEAQSRLSFRTAWVVLAMVCLLPQWAPAQEQEPEQEPIRVDVNLVQLRFTVTDQQGRFRNDLPLETFRILENGIEQDTVIFQSPKNRSGSTPRAWLAFLLDVSGSTFATRAEEIAAAQTFLDNITAQTHTGIFGFTDRLLTFQDFTIDRSLALRAFREARRHLGQTAIYESLSTLMTQMQSLGSPGDRKAIILVSDGLDDQYRRSTASASLARQYGIAVYTILVPSAAQIYIGSSPEHDSSRVNQVDPDQDAKTKAFAAVASRSGGLHFSGFEAILDFDGTLAQINDDIFGNLYTIGYNTDNPELSLGERRLDILVTRSGLRASLPFRRDSQQISSKRQYVAALFQDPKENLGWGSPDLVFREIHVDVDILAPRRDGTSVGLPFRIKVSPYNFGDAERNGVQTQLGIIGTLVDSEGQEAVRLREILRVRLGAKEVRQGKAIIYSNKLFAPPGNYELRLALLEIPTWRLTSFSRPVKIPSM